MSDEEQQGASGGPEPTAISGLVQLVLSRRKPIVRGEPQRSGRVWIHSKCKKGQMLARLRKRGRLPY